MKQIILGALILLGLNIGAFAQAAPAKKEQPKMQVVKKADAKVVPITATPAQPAKPAVPAPAKVSTPAASASAPGHLKKDGTPDKRFKENKHMKKDGTPDKRFKENKG